MLERVTRYPGSMGHAGDLPEAVSQHVSQRVINAMQAVPRASFLPDDVQKMAGDDHALPIGFGQTNSQPRTVAAMLDLLEVHPGQKVLDVGAGSGWSTALLGHLVGPSGSVLGLELVPELAAEAATTLSQHDVPWAEVHEADPQTLGAPHLAPFDRILVSAGADSLPQVLVEQLADTGVMVLPVNSQMLRVTQGDDDVAVTTHGTYSFVPLR